MCSQYWYHQGLHRDDKVGKRWYQLGARGGVYIGGGIVPRLGAGFDAATFRRQFESKGRFADYLKAVPTSVITAATPALIGASSALDLMAS